MRTKVRIYKKFTAKKDFSPTLLRSHIVNLQAAYQQIPELLGMSEVGGLNQSSSAAQNVCSTLLCVSEPFAGSRLYSSSKRRCFQLLAKLGFSSLHGTVMR